MKSLLIPVVALLAGCASERPLLAEREITLGAPQSRALAIVRIQAPWYAPSFLITGKFVDAIPEYAGLAGLEYKAFTLSDDRKFGGVYRWRSRADAEAWFNVAWHDRVKQQRGVEGDVRILDARWTVMGDSTPVGKALLQHGLRTDAAVTWLATTRPLAGASDERLRSLAAVLPLVPGLVTTVLGTELDGKAGAVLLWTSRAAAERFWTDDRRAMAAEALGTEVDLIWFSAPVLLDAAAAQSHASR